MMLKDNEIFCRKCKCHIFKVTKSYTLEKSNGFIMLECMECSHIWHERILNECDLS